MTSNQKTKLPDSTSIPTVSCMHEPYHGECVHCGIKFDNGNPVSDGNSEAVDCPNCNGKKVQAIADTCQRCSGKGYVNKPDLTASLQAENKRLLEALKKADEAMSTCECSPPNYMAMAGREYYFDSVKINEARSHIYALITDIERKGE